MLTLSTWSGSAGFVTTAPTKIGTPMALAAAEIAAAASRAV